jgi:hypothetical protein
MVERGTRPVSPELASKAAQVLAVPATALPLGVYQSRPHDGFLFNIAFGSTRVFGIRLSCWDGEDEPDRTLMDALDSEDLDPRVTEALPWLPVKYPELDWEWLNEERQNAGSPEPRCFYCVPRESGRGKEGLHRLGKGPL